MPFDRYLAPEFVEALNDLYTNRSSWWHQLANDGTVFLAVRRNAINAYVNGGSVGRVRWDGRAIALWVNRAYLVFADGAQRDRYANLLNLRNDLRPIVVANSDAFKDHLRKIKRIVGTYFGKERQGENAIAATLPEVLDIEAAFDTDAEGAESEFENDNLRQGRVDLVAVAKDGPIVFTEAKLFNNRELRASRRRVPAVCDQLILYHHWLVGHTERIQTAYTNLLYTCYPGLNGAFFRRRFTQGRRELSLDLVPRLLVFSFDGNQLRSAREIAQSVCDGVVRSIPGFTRRHIRLVGSVRNVNVRHLI